jgi:hypothetical protein
MPTTKVHPIETVRPAPPRPQFPLPQNGAMCKRFASAILGRGLQSAEIEDHFRLVNGFTDRPGPGRFEAISFVDR